jgi:hypothetical protein
LFADRCAPQSRNDLVIRLPSQTTNRFILTDDQTENCKDQTHYRTHAVPRLATGISDILEGGFLLNASI